MKPAEWAVCALVACVGTLGCGARSTLQAERYDTAPGEGGGAAVGSSATTTGVGGGCTVDGGACGQADDCCAGHCSAGICGAPLCAPDDVPVTLADGIVWPIGPVVHGAYVYIASYDEDGAVYRVRRDGAGAERWIDLVWPHDIATDAERVYVTTDAGVVAIPHDDPDAAEVLSSTFGGAGVGLTATRVVWAEYFGKAVRAVDKDGTGGVTLADLDASPFRLQVRGQRVVFTAHGLYELSLDNPTTSLVEPAPVRSFAIADDGALWWSRNQGGSHEVVSETGTLLYAGDTFVDGVLIDGDRLYAFATERIVHASLGGGEVAVLWEGDSLPGLFAQDGECLYAPIRPAADPDDIGALVRIAKPQ